ncbi:hypothetical protein L596_030781 [Steinernema carpocapsae]|uniref:7TM GPCR serpentine receptor class x (Srx) domain-containing protein n=1 Tax=Steinernema carpocapsae TaxID=34508 RepID=A0A4U5LNR9_STECR|nr:hypothetical protein L596_030781 [Steinernema carpocapsae]
MYAAALHLSATHPIYFFNRSEGVSTIMVSRGNHLIVNPIHYYNNIVKCAVISISSVIICFYIRREVSRTSHMTNLTTRMERNVSIQVVIMTLISDVAVVSYVITDWNENPVKSWIFYGTIIQFGWAMLHGVNGIVYLTLNRSVRNSAKQLLNNAVRSNRSNEVTTIPSAHIDQECQHNYFKMIYLCNCKNDLGA